jgi:hypothetical protein
MLGTNHRAGGAEMSTLNNRDMTDQFEKEISYGVQAHPTRRFTAYESGISLRDYFAGQAMISMVGHSISIAKEAYQIADAMLEARTKQD